MLNNVPECYWMARNVKQCLLMLWNDPQWKTMSPNVIGRNYINIEEFSSRILRNAEFMQCHFVSYMWSQYYWLFLVFSVRTPWLWHFLWGIETPLHVNMGHADPFPRTRVANTQSCDLTVVLENCGPWWPLIAIIVIIIISILIEWINCTPAIWWRCYCETNWIVKLIIILILWNDFRARILSCHVPNYYFITIKIFFWIALVASRTFFFN